MHEVAEGTGSTGRVRVERGIYRQVNGKYVVCFILDGKPRFRTVGSDLELARAQRLSFMRAARFWGRVGSAVAAARDRRRLVVRATGDARLASRRWWARRESRHSSQDRPRSRLAVGCWGAHCCLGGGQKLEYLGAVVAGSPGDPEIERL